MSQRFLEVWPSLFWLALVKRTCSGGDPSLSALPRSTNRNQDTGNQISITHKITRYPSANFARRSTFGKTEPGLATS